MPYTPGLTPVLGSNAAGYYDVAGGAPQSNFISQPGAASSAATYGAAGIGAAGQAVSTIAQIMANTAARNNALQLSADNRDGNERLAKMQIAAAAAMADKARAQQAQQFLVQSLVKGASAPLRAWDTQRAANNMGASLIAKAFG